MMRKDFKVLICGDRRYTQQKTMDKVFIEITKHVLRNNLRPVIITGDGSGADELAGQFARAYDWLHIIFPADWEQYGKGAGPIRNLQMVRIGRPHVVIGFHDNLVKSKGTKDTLLKAVDFGVPTFLVADGNYHRVTNPSKLIYTRTDILFKHDD